jgi:hypothetical protein
MKKNLEPLRLCSETKHNFGQGAVGGDKCYCGDTSFPYPHGTDRRVMSEIMFFPKAELTETEKPVYELVNDQGKVLGKFAVVPVSDFEIMEAELLVLRAAFKGVMS